MSRFILRFTGQGDMPPADLAQVRASPLVKIVDDSSTRMLLVETGEKEVQRLMKQMTGWTFAPETSRKLPDPTVRIEKPPS